jgi:hypothetical protein
VSIRIPITPPLHHSITPADRLRVFQREAAGEDGELREEGLFLRGQEGDRPVDDGAQGSLPRGKVGGAALEEAEALRQAGEDLARRQRREPRRRQFDRQRDPLEAAAELGHVCRVLRREGEVGAAGRRPLQEERLRVRRRQRQDLGTPFRAQFERPPRGDQAG